VLLGSGAHALAQVPLVVCQVLFVLLAYTLLQGHLFLRQRQEMNPRTRRRLLPVAQPYLGSGGRLLSAAILFAVAGGVRPRSYWNWRRKARAKLLPKMKQIRRDVYHLLQNARPP